MTTKELEIFLTQIENLRKEEIKNACDAIKNPKEKEVFQIFIQATKNNKTYVFEKVERYAEKR